MNLSADVLGLKTKILRNQVNFLSKNYLDFKLFCLMFVFRNQTHMYDSEISINSYFQS